MVVQPPSLWQFTRWHSADNGSENLWSPHAQYRISAFLCPSDDAYSNGGGEVYMTGTWSGAVGHLQSSTSTEAGKTNYVGVTGQLGGHIKQGYWGEKRGIFGCRTKNTFGTVTDGSSNVLMFGEVTGTYDDWDKHNRRIGRVRAYLWVHNGLPTELHHPWYEQNTSWGHRYKFSSMHIGAANWGLADGSVQTISENIDADLLIDLSGIRDGVVAQIPQ